MAEGKIPTRPDGGTEEKRDRGTSQDGLDARRQKLGEELSRHQALKKPEPSREPTKMSGIGQAFKLSSEFLAGIVVGILLGLGFDQLAGTNPWGLIIFLFLGFAAGILNVLRSVGRIAPSQIGQNGLNRDKQGANRKEDDGDKPE